MYFNKTNRLNHYKTVCQIKITNSDVGDNNKELIPGFPTSSTICPPFHCDHGHGIKVGENVFINYGATMLDEGWITIGDRSVIGAGSVVVKDIPADSMAVGNQARVIRKLR